MTHNGTGDPNAALIAFICHELAGPAATAQGASELLGAEYDEEINGLVQGAARRLSGLVRLVRTGFGPPAGAIGGVSLAKIAAQASEAEPVSWTGGSDGIDAERAAILSALCLLVARPGGPLILSETEVSAPNRRPLDPAVAATLRGDPPEIVRSAAAAAQSVHDRAARQGLRLTVGEELGVTVRLVADAALPGEAAALPVDIADSAGFETSDRLTQA